MQTTTAGKIGKLGGVALVAPEASANLISLMVLCQKNNATFRGDKNSLVVQDPDGKVILHGVNHGDNFWSVGERDLKAYNSFTEELSSEIPLLERQAIVSQSSDGDGNPIISKQIISESTISKLTAEERGRAEEAFQLCNLLRHPGDAAVINALDSNLFHNCHLTSNDFRNARSLLGPCPACTEGKMVAPPEPTSLSEPARKIGDRVHCDLIPLKTKCVNGTTVLLYAIDEKSKKETVIPLKSKGANDLTAGFKLLLLEFNCHGHAVSKITTDDEGTFGPSKRFLAEWSVKLRYYPAGLHEKSAEAGIRRLKEAKAAVLSSLSYVLPDTLEAELYSDVVNWRNRVPHSSLNRYTCPHHEFSGEKSQIPNFTFGQFGLFYNKKKELDQRSEWGLFIGYGDSGNYLRCYNPLTNTITSKRKFVPQHVYPTAWNLQPRLRTKSLRQLPLLPASFSPPIHKHTGNIHVQSNRPLVPVNNSTTTQEGGNVSHSAPTSVQLQSTSSPISSASNSNSNSDNDVRLPSAIASHQEGGVNTAISSSGDSLSQEGGSRNVPSTSSSGDSLSQEGGSRNVTSTSVSNSSIPESRSGSVTQASNIVSNSGPVNTKKSTPAPPSDRVLRSQRGSWKDGPAKSKRSEAYFLETIKEAARTFNVTSLKASLDPCRTILSKSEHEAQHNNNFFEEWKDIEVKAMKVSLKNLLKYSDRKASIMKAIFDEIDNFEAPGVTKPIKFKNIPQDYKQFIIGTYMFHKEKFKADGSFDKDKCRLVILSNQRDPDTIGESFSPTVNPVSTLTQLNLAAVEPGTLISAYDIKGAFLKALMEEGKRMFMRIDPEITKLWVQRYPQRAKYIHSDGCLYLEMLRYIYGLHEAPHQFNNLLDKVLQDIGFKPTKADKCFYVKEVNGTYVRVSVHVDDLLLTSPNKHLQKWFERELEKHFELVKQYSNVSYLGIQVCQNITTGDISLSQKGYIENLLKKYNCQDLKKVPLTPSTSKLTEYEEEDVEPTDKKEFLSIVMALMYVARFTRPDINFTISYLATKCSKPTKTDYKHLIKVLKYLSGTIDEGLIYKSRVPFCPTIWADSSHLLYPKGHGQQGMFATNGSAPVAHRSIKIKLITRSSSESELCALEEASTFAVWYRLLLSEMGISISDPIPITQDNKSTIIMAVQGPSFKRTKHLMGRKTYIKERIAAKEVTLRYVRTKDMLADILTKPVDGTTLNHLKAKLFIVKISRYKKN